jgi:hypothetical protein
MMIIGGNIPRSVTGREIVKRVLAALVALVLVLATAAPVLADDPGGGVIIGPGGGNLPVVKCLWETPDGHEPDGTQVDPPLYYGGIEPVTLYVVVTDVEDHGDVAQVVADVFHPQGLPEDGSLKYGNLRLTQLAWSAGMAAFAAADSSSLVAYSGQYDYTEVLDELEQGEAMVWSVSFNMDYCQPAGIYTVTAVAVDHHGNTSLPFSNTFEYVAVCGIELDFSAVNYPNVMIGSSVDVSGDTTWGGDRPTVRNIGNTDVKITVWQDDMGFGTYWNGSYKVEFDARMGPRIDDADSTRVIYPPNWAVTLPNVLALCGMAKLDFSIHILFAMQGHYQGRMVVSCTIEPFHNLG